MKRKTTCNYAKLFTQSFQFSCVLTCSCAELSLRLSSLRRASSSICALFFFSTCSLCFRFATFLFWSFTCLLIRGKKNHTIIYMHWKKKYFIYILIPLPPRNSLKTNKEFLLQKFSNTFKCSFTKSSKLLTMMYQEHVFQHVLYEVQ